MRWISALGCSLSCFALLACSSTSTTNLNVNTSGGSTSGGRGGASSGGTSAANGGSTSTKPSTTSTTAGSSAVGGSSSAVGGSSTAAGGSSASASGGSGATGGSRSSTGGQSSTTVTTTGGRVPTGGATVGGQTQVAGAPTGGKSATGGALTGGMPTGGSPTGGVTPTGGSTSTLFTLGHACSSGTQCSTNYCVDGVCCESPCNGVCQACGSTGLCNQTPATDSGCSAVTCPGNSTCASYTAPAAGACKSFGACATASDCAKTSAAARTSCATGSLCDGQGNCVHATVGCGGSTCDMSYQQCCMLVDANNYACQNSGAICGTTSQWQAADSGVVTTCDQDSDCPTGQSCCMTNGNGNITVSCIAAASCPGTVPPYITYYPVCSSPATSTSCPAGTSCQVQWDSTWGYVIPASWKVCY